MNILRTRTALFLAALIIAAVALTTVAITMIHAFSPPHQQDCPEWLLLDSRQGPRPG